MRRLTRWLPSALLAGPLLLAGCEPGVTAPQGEVRGVVLVEGTSLQGIVVELTGPQVRSETTDTAGRYVFENVPSGAYVVTVQNVTEDASFPATSRTAVVSGGRTVTVDFLGNYIRTAVIEGTVTAGSRGLAGVTVTLEGVESGTRITGRGGAFAFSGLRAGDYQVQISGLPPSVTFPSVRTEVELATGQTFLVTFNGTAELTASVVIRSIERRLPDGSLALAEWNNLRGEVEVTLVVDRGLDTVEAVDLLLGDEPVGGQTFRPGGLGSAGPAPQAPALLEVRLPVNTAAFDEATGAVRFPNGQRSLTARLATVEGGRPAAAASVQVQLRNANTFTGTVAPAQGPVLGEDGEPWIGGDLAVSVLPVLYDASRAVESVTLGLRRAGGAQLRTLDGVPGPSSAIVFGADGAPGADNLSGYQTPVGATDELRVVAARYEDGDPVPGTPAVLGTGLRIDNVAPAPPAFALPVQGAETACCLDNWVGADFLFASALGEARDAGVGGVSVRVHAGGASLPDGRIALEPEVLGGADLPPTEDNLSLRAVAAARDGLGNLALAPLSASGGNPWTNASGAVFGVDLSPPELDFDAASVGDRARNPPPGSAWVLAVSDGAAGSGPLSARTSVRAASPTLVGAPEQCLFPGAGPCDPVPDGLLRGVPTGIEGYITLASRVLDRAGNVSPDVRRSVLVDLTPPVLGALRVPPTFVPDEPAAFRAAASDNLDLHRGWVSWAYGDAGDGGGEVIAAGAPVPLGEPFDDEFTTDATLASAVPLVVGLERVLPAADLAAPAGTVLGLASARAVVTDAAGNHGTTPAAPLAGAAGLPTRSFSVAERGATGGVADWTLAAASGRVCRSGGAGPCGPGAPASLRLSATARGLGGALEQPFRRVHFYLVQGGEPEMIATAEAAGQVDGAGPLGREWSWSADWTPGATVALGPSVLFAVGVDAEGHALRSLDLASVSVVEGGR